MKHIYVLHPGGGGEYLVEVNTSSPAHQNSAIYATVLTVMLAPEDPKSNLKIGFAYYALPEMLRALTEDEKLEFFAYLV